MPTEAKQAAVAELVELLKESDSAIVSDHRGLSVADLLKVRRELREKDIQYRVIVSVLSTGSTREKMSRNSAHS